MRTNKLQIDNKTSIPVSKQNRIKQAIENPYLIRRELNDRSLFEFVKWGWPEVSPDDFEDNWHIEKICKELEKVAYRVGANLPKKYDLIINVPPGTSKTRVVSILFQTWCWTKWFHFNFITASHASSLANENADYVRDLLKSERFKRVYPELEVRPDKDSKSNFKIAKVTKFNPGKPNQYINGGSRYSTSVGGMGIGLHAHIQICDDLINPKEALSENALAGANHFLDHTLSGRKTNKKVTPLILVMQRLSEDDPTGHLLAKNNKKIKHICLPGQIRDYKKFVKPKKWIKYYKDDLLDVNRLDWKTLNGLETDLGQYGYAGQIGQNPTPPGGGMFKVDNLKKINSIEGLEIRRSVRSWDKAATTDGGAYTAGIKMVELKTGEWVIEDVRRGQWSTNKREKIIKQTAITDGSETVVLIEQEPGSGGKESAQATIKNLAGFSCEAHRPTGDKELRADPFSVQVNNFNVLLIEGSWNYNFIEELRLFPFAKFKDQVDAASAAFNYLTRKKKVRRLT